MGTYRFVFIVGSIFPLLHRVGHVYFFNDEKTGKSDGEINESFSMGTYHIIMPIKKPRK